jgi:hypothetical protein
MSNRYQAAIITASYNGLLAPNAPTIGTATAGNASASVAFTAPSNVGGGAITSYTAISSPGGIVGTGATSPVTVSGLTNGTAYTFTVVATNSYGSGPVSAASNSVTPAIPNYIEEVFSTWLYTGNGTTQTITNGIDLAGEGGLNWTKCRSSADNTHILTDTVRGGDSYLVSSSTAAQGTNPTVGIDFESTGYYIDNAFSLRNESGSTYASWTFAEQPKFFDVVTYTGNNTAGRTVAHNLGSAPGCIIVKQIDGSGPWTVYHRSPGATKYLILNNTDAEQTFSGTWNNTTPTATEFTLGASGFVNAPGATYVAYLFAHNAGGFGLTGTDNVISCGSYTAGSSETTVTLGYEPQWTMIKASSTADEWRINDNMRGVATGGIDRNLWANLSNAEAGSDDRLDYNATGFTAKLNNSNPGETYIYIAIRRGPMAVPTTGTSVFSPNATSASTGTTLTTGFPVDLSIAQARTSGDPARWEDRLRGANSPNNSGATPTLRSDSTAAETTATITLGWSNIGIQVPSYYSGASSIFWNFRRAPGFFDEVCYTGDSTAGRQVAHGLAAVPELMIVKGRNQASTNWAVYSSSISNTLTLYLNATLGQSSGSSYWNSTSPTSSVFTVGDNSDTNVNTYTYVAYLFASCPGVSKVGSFTGTGATQVINCGFTGGARFVLIKSTSASGAWYVWDSARGIVAGNDPYLALNSSAAEVTNTDWVDTAASGFELSNAGGNLANSSGVSYIFLAIA